MYIKDGIAYADSPRRPAHAAGVRPLDNYQLWVLFESGEVRIFDVRPLLESSVFAPLADENLFRAVYLDYGVPTWMDGAIDIDPEWIFAAGRPV